MFHAALIARNMVLSICVKVAEDVKDRRAIIDASDHMNPAFRRSDHEYR
ncbi:hypothetical protein KX928_15540 [Roseobacter sp. YSTF-M11]|uniref:Uncharacterized protein n=1 Tax=Roseobacter insulae TaxID=2859783 RepID=A0A9X1FXI3_9RHOB|nr:hypothetical protein [Roseobacter insulae]MBW4709204.1 hypothetical protein [Roseobacter insulae]